MAEKVFCKSNHMHYSLDGQADPNQQYLPTGFILSLIHHQMIVDERQC